LIIYTFKIFYQDKLFKVKKKKKKKKKMTVDLSEGEKLMKTSPQAAEEFYKNVLSASYG